MSENTKQAVPTAEELCEGGGNRITYLTIGNSPVALVYRDENLPLRAVGFDFETGTFKKDARLFLAALEEEDVWDSDAESFAKLGEALLSGAAGEGQ